MSCYVKLEMNCTTFTQLTDYLVELITKLDNPYNVMELVRLIDFLDEEKANYNAKQNEELQRDIEIQRLFEETYVDRSIVSDNFMYYKIEKILKTFGVKLDIETEFHLIMHIIDLINNKEETE